MDAEAREKAETHIVVTLATTPKHVWKHLHAGNPLHSDPARHELALRIVDTILAQFELIERPPPKSPYDR